MDQVQRVALSEEDFVTLVSGGVVKQRSVHGVEIEIILSDIGFDQMRVGLDRAYLATIEDGYRNERWAERNCDHCGKPYQGPTVYCSHACAVGDR